MTIDNILLLSLGVVILLILAYRIFQRKVRIDAAIKEIIAKRVHEIRVELHGDTIFWYDSETNQFFAQGKTVDECVTILKSVYSNDVFLYNTPNNQYLLAGPDFDMLPLNPETPPEGML